MIIDPKRETVEFIPDIPQNKVDSPWKIIVNKTTPEKLLIMNKMSTSSESPDEEVDLIEILGSHIKEIINPPSLIIGGETVEVTFEIFATMSIFKEEFQRFYNLIVEISQEIVDSQEKILKWSKEEDEIVDTFIITHYYSSEYNRALKRNRLKKTIDFSKDFSNQYGYLLMDKPHIMNLSDGQRGVFETELLTLVKPNLIPIVKEWEWFHFSTPGFDYKRDIYGNEDSGFLRVVNLYTLITKIYIQKEKQFEIENQVNIGKLIARSNGAKFPGDSK